MAEKPKKTCFVVGPIGDDTSDDRVHADWLLDGIITPVFEAHYKEFEVRRADRISDPGRIDAQVITSLLDSELVIADLTSLNPNAFYEIGIRHTAQKPIIHMHLEGQRIPFDVASFRSIKFNRTRPSDLATAQKNLKAAIDAALAADHVVDNPVTFARGRVQFAESATATEKLLSDEIDSLKQRIEMIEFECSQGEAGAVVHSNLRLSSSILREREHRIIKLVKTVGMTNDEFFGFINEHVRPIFPEPLKEAGNSEEYEFVVPAKRLGRRRILELGVLCKTNGVMFTVYDVDGRFVAGQNSDLW
ncbi:hypothetical protein HGO38_10790 [Rhizobium sp. CG5]|uniref:hypothetical protein n=1 Tax=Rhizobium sp. CG5 TaxID=2726076 RepID=UPI0020343B01|nr:hypothetical protein [Rhizobium sp. CG5]MCM2473959.1 hypothetical protein [Rhizobium sp. CG5]